MVDFPVSPSGEAMYIAEMSGAVRRLSDTPTAFLIQLTSATAITG
jgi:hypothetical protein